MDTAYKATDEVHVFPVNLPIPGLGFLPINAFLLKSREPVLIDTGLGVERNNFIAALESVIDPRELRWVWLTHDDADHTGAIQEVMRIAPNAKLVTHALAAMRMSTWWDVPLDRVHAIGPGQKLDVGDRTLVGFAPPVFDNPMSTGIYDAKSGILFSVDSFGALIDAPAQDAKDVPQDVLAQGMVAWATEDSPWTSLVDERKFGAVLEEVRALGPKMILSSHLPPASNRTEEFLKLLATVPRAEHMPAPDQAMFSEMVAQLTAPAGA
ncbi:MAG TPA: MBL fold metallo-hydrolase [Dehalococcoidia bacterium]|nr:MBL fold metallo-hydrolase [Dehalococcoidia bacterium]